MIYTIVNINTGMIRGGGSASEKNIAVVRIDSDELMITGVHAGRYDYYSDGEIKPRPVQSCTQDVESILADGIEKSVFSGVDIGSEIFIDGVSQGVEDGDGIVEVTFDTAGDYEIKFVLFPFLDKEFTINAN